VSARAIAEWRNRVRAEYGSAGLAAQVVHWMIQAAFPEQLVDTGLRIVSDELAHAKMSHDVVQALGGGEEPLAIDVRMTAFPQAPEGILASLVDSVLRNFCFGETFAVPLFAAMREHTTEPPARTALNRILKDEAVHRAFGWDALDVLLSIDGAGVRQRVSHKAPGYLKGFRNAYCLAEGRLLSSSEQAWGLLEVSQYAEIVDQCWKDSIKPRLLRRDIHIA